MIRNAVRALLVLVAAFALACTDAPSAPALPEQSEASALTLSQASADIHWTRGCPTIGPLSVLAIAIMSHNNEDRRMVVARLGQLSEEVRARRQERIRERAHALVDFLLQRYQAGKFRGTDAQFAALINAIYCFAGIDIDVDSPKNTELILPSDQPQVVLVNNGQAGVQLEANPVTEPTLITVEQLPDTFSNNGFLDTKLDQYPGFLLVTKQSEGNAPLAKPVVVAVCATGAIPSAVRDRLRLGHGKATGFEIAEPGDASFLTCPTVVGAARPATGWARVGELLMPKRVQAFQQEFGGGVGGTVTEFSPFAPVDPELQFGGGVGGTVTEFTRMGFKQQSALLDRALAVTGACSTPIEGAEGSPLRDACRPYISLTTRLGTPFIGVPITWDVTLGGGSVAGNTGACGTFGTSATNVTGPNGRAGICWTLGTVGANQVRATPSLGGDAVDGVSFSPASTTFDAIANPPAGLSFTEQPPAIVRAGLVFPTQVTVVDKNGERVWNSTEKVSLTLDHGSFADGTTTFGTLAVAGVANFGVNVIGATGTYRMSASAKFLLPPAVLPLSAPFDVTPGIPWTLVIQAGNGVSGAAGQASPVDPSLLVTDRYGNPVPNATVRWNRLTDGVYVTVGTTLTDANGIASTSWVLGVGENALRANLLEGSFASVIFNATGTAP